MQQFFIDHLERLGYDKKKLNNRLNEIDAQKRSIKSSLSRLSSEPRAGDPKGRERQTLIRRMKDKASFLTEERELIRNRIGEIKRNTALINNAKNKKAGFCEAFYAASEQMLSTELMNEIESKALAILEQNKQI